MIHRFENPLDPSSPFHFIEFKRSNALNVIMYRDNYSSNWRLSSFGSLVKANDYYSNAGWKYSQYYDPNDLQIAPNQGVDPTIDANGVPLQRLTGPKSSMQDYVDNLRASQDQINKLANKYTPVPLPISNKCNCPMRDLMMKGCTCGGK